MSHNCCTFHVIATRIVALLSCRVMKKYRFSTGNSPRKLWQIVQLTVLKGLEMSSNLSMIIHSQNHKLKSLRLLTEKSQPLSSSRVNKMKQIPPKNDWNRDWKGYVKKLYWNVPNKQGSVILLEFRKTCPPNSQPGFSEIIDVNINNFVSRI